MRTLAAIFGFFVRTLTIIVAWVGGVATTINTATLNAIPMATTVVIGQTIILFSGIVFMAIGYFLNLQALVVIASIVSAISAFIFWRLPDLALELCSRILGRTWVVGTSISSTCVELRRMIWPLLTGSMALAFVGSSVAIRGVGYYSAEEILMAFAMLNFAILFLYYIDSKS